VQRKATTQTSEQRTLCERGIALELGCAGIVQRNFECVPKMGKAFSAAEELDEGACHHVAIGGGGGRAQMIAALNDAEHRRSYDPPAWLERRWLGPKMRSATAMAAALLPNRRSNGVQAPLTGWYACKTTSGTVNVQRPTRCIMSDMVI
jgi:hypothetical protein